MGPYGGHGVADDCLVSRGISYRSHLASGVS